MMWAIISHSSVYLFFAPSPHRPQLQDFSLPYHSRRSDADHRHGPKQSCSPRAKPGAAQNRNMVRVHWRLRRHCGAPRRAGQSSKREPAKMSAGCRGSSSIERAHQSLNLSGHGFEDVVVIQFGWQSLRSLLKNIALWICNTRRSQLAFRENQSSS